MRVPNQRMKLTGAAILVSRGMKVLQAAPAAYLYRSAAKEIVMNLAGMSTPGLLKMHSAVHEALEIDDMLHLSGLPKTYGVRDFADWRAWADALEI